MYLHVQEKLLQEECGYEGGIPYWDEQRDFELYGNIEDASIWGSDEYSLGTNGVTVGNSTDKCVIDGAFANTTLRMDQIWGVDYYDEYCLSREFNQTAYEMVNQTNVDECFALETYNDANFCYVDKPHSGGHLGVSGTLENQNASPGDPVFFLHHANLDRLWWKWQKANLTARLEDMSGIVVPALSVMLADRWVFPSDALLKYSGDAGNTTTLNHTLWMMNIVPNATIAEVMDLRGELICADYIEADE